jgi:hypothetical protein
VADDAEIMDRLIQEAAVRSSTDTQVHAEIEMTRQILTRMANPEEVDEDVQALISLAASIAITLHDPMDGRPFF